MKLYGIPLIRGIFIFLSLIILFEGTYLILSNEEKEEVNVSKTYCLDEENAKRQQCYEDLIDNTLNKKGLGEAFEIFDILFRDDPVFAADCHSYSHKLGEKAYHLFAQNKEFQLTPKTSYCGYGFYHGFMETFLLSGRDMEEAHKFCEFADAQLRKLSSDAGGACYHGIGHGTVDGSDPRAWGNPQAMIQPSLDLCEKISNDENPPPQYGKLFRCVSGAFNALEILSTSNQYKLSLNREDPFWICRNQPDRYKEACYSQFVVALMAVTNNDFNKSAKTIGTIHEDAYALPALQALVVELVRLGKTDYQDTINYCRNLKSRFHLICVSSFGEGFLKYGPPEEEYVEALKFCNSPLLRGEEKSICFERVLSLLRQWYTVEKSREICLSVDERYSWRNCQYN